MEDSKWVCRNCRCYWRKHSLGWSLWDGDQIPCKACDNGPDFLRLLDRVETTPSPSDSLPPLPSAEDIVARLRNREEGDRIDITMEQAADLIDRLAARLAETQAKHTANHDAWLDEVVRLKRELSEAQKDAERYRWLRDSRGTTPFVVDGKGWPELWSKLVCADLDVAIDAAMKEGK